MSVPGSEPSSGEMDRRISGLRFNRRRGRSSSSGPDLPGHRSGVTFFEPTISARMTSAR